MKKSMFFGASNLIFERAKALRSNMTPSELILWNHLRQSPAGHKFRRQHPISDFIVDFYCHSLNLVIEVDGGIHQDKETAQNDMERQKHLETKGISFLSFTNEDVDKRLGIVIDEIGKYIEKKSVK